ncbi:MAG: AAA family ATPase [Pseudomonadota bacterium]
MYDTHYGLSGRPFQLTPDPRFWFDTATHKKAMAYLGYGLSQGEGFIVITGDIGAGKTTLVGHLVDTVDAERLNVIRIVSTQIAADDLLRTVCAGLAVDAAGLSKAQMLGAIERGLHAVARGGRRTLLIVDEAQALPVDSLEELRMLSNFQAGGFALLQIFLLGQPEFREKLSHDGLEQLRQRVIAMHHLGPMEADELEPYLIHRLTVVGWDGRPRFKTDALATIYAWSGGIPRRINALVSRVLLHGAIEGIDTFTAADVMTVVGDLESDGMTGGATPAIEPELDFAAPEPVAEAPPVDHDVAAEIPAPVEDAVIAEEPAAMEWPFVADEPEPAEDWRPIAAEDVAAFAEPEVAARPIVLEPPVVQPEPEAVETRPVEITAPPRLFDRISLLGRKPILAPVDPAPKVEERTVEIAPASGVEEPVTEWVPAHPSAPVIDLDIARRLVEIDRRLEDQDVALRRVLTLLVDWVEGNGSRPQVSDQDFPELRDRVG